MEFTTERESRMSKRTQRKSSIINNLVGGPARRPSVSFEAMRGGSRVMDDVPYEENLQMSLQRREIQRRIDLQTHRGTSLLNRLRVKLAYRLDEIIAQRGWQLFILVVVVTIMTLLGGGLHMVADHTASERGQRQVAARLDELGWQWAEGVVRASGDGATNDSGSFACALEAEVAHLSHVDMQRVEPVVGALAELGVDLADPVAQQISEYCVPMNDFQVRGRMGESMWLAWTFLADPGTQAEMLQWESRLTAAIITICGIFFFAFIFGFVVDGVVSKMNALKKGTSNVVESGHTVILGWSDKSLWIIREIAEANSSETVNTAEHSNVIVILASVDKQLLEMEIKEGMSREELAGTKVVCRSGSPLHSYDLQKVSCSTARAVIVLSEPNNPDAADATTLRVVLSLKGLRQTLEGYIVAECQDVDNAPLIQLVGGSSVETVVSHDMIGRLLLVAMHEPGLAKVYRTTLGFAGHEFYIEEWPELVGVKFGDITERMPDAIPFGVKQLNGAIKLKPSNERVMRPGEELVVIAEDNDTYSPQEPLPVEEDKLTEKIGKDKKVEKILICGFRRDIRDLIIQLDSMVVRGTELHLVNEVPLSERDMVLEEGGLDVGSLQNVQLVHFFANTANRRHLEQLPLASYTGGMVLGDQSLEDEPMNSDSHSLATLLSIREMQLTEQEIERDEAAKCERHEAVDQKVAPNGVGDAASRVREEGGDSSAELHRLMYRTRANSFMSMLGDRRRFKGMPIVCEILDSRTQANLEMISSLSIAADFVKSNEMVSQVLAMVSENREVRVILDELLGAKGAKLSVRSSSYYVTRGEVISFMQLAKRVQRIGEILCGYSLEGGLGEPVMNPPDKMLPRCWTGVDLVVLTGESATAAANSTMQAVKRLQQRTTNTVSAAADKNAHVKRSRTRRASLVEVMSRAMEGGGQGTVAVAAAAVSAAAVKAAASALGINEMAAADGDDDFEAGKAAPPPVALGNSTAGSPVSVDVHDEYEPPPMYPGRMGRRNSVLPGFGPAMVSSAMGRMGLADPMAAAAAAAAATIATEQSMVQEESGGSGGDGGEDLKTRAAKVESEQEDFLAELAAM